MHKRDFLFKRIKNSLKKHLIRYISNHFENYDIHFPDHFYSRLEKKIDGILNDYIKPSLYRRIEANFDLLTLGELNLKEILGFDNALKLIQISLNATFELISSEEPVDVISDFLKSKNKFLVMIEFSFKDYIINSIKKRFPFLKKIAQEKEEIIFGKVINIISDNYNYYKDYDPNRSKFKTFLYKDTIFTAVKVFREENLNYYQFVLSKAAYDEYIKKYGVKLKNNEILQWERKAFSSKNELSDWMESEFEENSFKTSGQYIWSYVKSVEGYADKFQYLDNTFITPEINSRNWENETNFAPTSAKKAFFKKLSEVENDPTLRLVLKIILGLDINYLNNEIHYVFNESVSLDLIKKIHELLIMYGVEMKTNFYNEVHSLLKEKSPGFDDISVGSIQRRMNRNFKKFQKSYKQDVLNNLVHSITEDIDKYLFQNPPVFLKIDNLKDVELLYDKEFSSKLKIIDLSNCLLDEIPDGIFEIKTLEEIDLSNNMLKKIPKGFKTLEKLKLIILKNQFEKRNLSSSPSFVQPSSDEIHYLKNNLPDCRIII